MLKADPGVPSSDRDNPVIRLVKLIKCRPPPESPLKVCELRIDPTVAGHWQIAAQPGQRATL
jgi:hypothetical protein